ncbi:cell surface protein [Listeria floridensis FSL S10-1187]|uniref:Cell surface protein n=1 Tax=Listeria floridensis FSL S10-1187 TaxID=1265817 RepID=A0ABP3AXW8_9LIST|nr:WxL domain-containing protein [Listeria floridensis]EUJ30294.1 cell surface protein [Listeria floridensis FSL S10-1187]
MNLFKFTIASILAISSIAFIQTPSAFADTGKVAGNTTGKVNFSQDIAPVKPLDPKSPNTDKPITPLDPSEAKGTAGPLSIDYVSDFHFGDQVIATDDKTYDVELDEIKTAEGAVEKRAAFVQVTDTRGSNQGWALQVQQQTTFSAGADQELKGTYLRLSNPVITTTANNQSAKPKFTKETTILKPGKDGVAGDAQTIFLADKNTGMATWIQSFGDETTGSSSIQLYVPGVSVKLKGTTYSAILNWILLDAPI